MVMADERGWFGRLMVRLFGAKEVAEYEAAVSHATLLWRDTYSVAKRLGVAEEIGSGMAPEGREYVCLMPMIRALLERVEKLEGRR